MFQLSLPLSTSAADCFSTLEEVDGKIRPQDVPRDLL